jgi:hypothetical protein
MKQRLPWFGFALIAVGAVMLLHRFQVITIGWAEGLWIVLTGVGAVNMVRGFMHHRRGSIFWGWMLAAVAGYLALEKLDVVYLEGYLQMPALLIAVGVGLLLVFARHTAEWAYGLAGAVLGVLGVAIYGAESGWIDNSAVREAISQYWPVGLILLGAAILLSRGGEGKVEKA